MQYCTHCKVQLLETRKHCPLCGNSLKIETDQDISESFPKIDSYIKGTGKLKLLLFLSVVIIILSFTAYAFFPTELNYPLLITLGMGSLWLDMIFLVKRRFHIPKKIVWQVFFLYFGIGIPDGVAGLLLISSHFFILLLCFSCTPLR